MLGYRRTYGSNTLRHRGAPCTPATRLHRTATERSALTIKGEKEEKQAVDTALTLDIGSAEQIHGWYIVLCGVPVVFSKA